MRLAEHTCKGVNVDRAGPQGAPEGCRVMPQHRQAVTPPARIHAYPSVAMVAHPARAGAAMV